jgi:hypothetical protein
VRATIQPCLHGRPRGATFRRAYKFVNALFMLCCNLRTVG